MSSHPYTCGECGTGKGTYTPGCPACRRRRSRAEHQRVRRHGTPRPRAVLNGGQATELRRVLSTFERTYRTHRDDLPRSLALATDTLLETVRQILRDSQP